MPQTKTQGAVCGVFRALSRHALPQPAVGAAVADHCCRAGHGGVFRAIFHKQLVENDRKAFSSDTECDKMGT